MVGALTPEHFAMKWFFSATPLRWILVWLFVLAIIAGGALGWLG